MRKLRLTRKKCSKCGKVKTLDKFWNDKYTKDGKRYKCIECMKKEPRKEYMREYRKKYRRENKEKEKRRKREYYQKNKDDILDRWRDYQREYHRNYREGYYAKNKKRIRAYHREWENFNYHNNIQYHLRCRYGGQLQAFLRNNKKKTSIKYLGCTWEEFIQHIRSQYTEGMTDEKLLSGEIHLDHIYPLSRVDLTDEKECERVLHYTNIQPLWAKDNMQKGNTIPKGHD